MHAMAFIWDENDLKNNWFTTFSASIKSHMLVPIPRSDFQIVEPGEVAAQAVTPVNGSERANGVRGVNASATLR